MTATVQECFEEVLLEVRQPARLLGGEYGAGPGFSGSPRELRVVLGFPDTYEIGISNQALQILYSLARTVPDVGVERTYLPWVDALAAMRKKGVPLLTVESWTPVAEADLFALTMQHEFNYTNLLEMLSLAGIPVHAVERSESDPLVLIGGPACANFLPLTRFVDAVAVGDGEELFVEILKVLASAKVAGASREEKKRLLSEVEGVYVPGIKPRVRRRVLKRLEGAAFPEEILVPLAGGVHDRAWVEIMRGCTRGCRFCQAGMWYRPVRERSPGEIVRIAQAQVGTSGYHEVALASLSTSDHSGLEEVLRSLAACLPEVRVSLPSLRVDSATVRLAALASPTGASLTLAPEVGSPRMWKIVNKNVCEADVLSAAEEAFARGRTTLKLYFMIGLPWESDEDVAAIADLCLRIRDVGRRVLGAKAARLQLNISVNNFVPKPFTPFQWAGMAGRETLLRRQDLLRRPLRKPGVRLVTHDVERSYLEAALARGDEALGAVIESAWRRGARFDQWTEQFNKGAWTAAFAEIGASAEELATSWLNHEALLPWEVIDGVVARDFLWEEWERAQREESTGDCRWEACLDCGACVNVPGNDLAVGQVSTVERRDDEALTRAGATAAAVETRAQRYVARFSVHGRSRFLSHLDRLEVFRRAVRRAGGRLALTQGMRPRPRLSLVLPLAVGMESEEEMCEFVLAEAPPPDFVERLKISLPAGTRLLELSERQDRGSLAAAVTGAAYEVVVEPKRDRGGWEKDAAGWSEKSGGDHPDWAAAIGRAVEHFREATQLVVQDQREGRSRQVDVRKFVDEVKVARCEGGALVLSFEARVTPGGTARPEHVVAALSELTGVPLRLLAAKRTRIHFATKAGTDREDRQAAMP